MSVKFSIIVPVYNVAPYLRACLDSILAQTYTNWEAICVDDGSTDGSAVILDEYADKDSRIRVIHQANAGVSCARNVGLVYASGEWLWFVDGDDTINPEALKILNGATEDYPSADMVKYRNVCAEQEPDAWKSAAQNPPRLLVDKKDQLLQAFDGANKFVIRRECVKHFQFEHYRWLEDILYVIKSVGQSRNILLRSDVLYFYRIRPGSAIHSQRTCEQVAEIFRATHSVIDEAERIMREHPESNYYEYLKRLHALAYFTFREEYFSLTASERKALLESWLALQDRFSGRYPIPLEWRLRLLLVRLFRSGLLVKPFVSWGCHLRGDVSKLISKMKGLAK